MTPLAKNQASRPFKSPPTETQTLLTASSRTDGQENSSDLRAVMMGMH
jgi:hypothetical protein